MCQFSGETDSFDFFDPNMPKNSFWSWYLAPSRDQVCQFLVKMNNFEFFDLNLGKLPNYVQYVGSNNVDGVAESWVEAEMS